MIKQLKNNFMQAAFATTLWMALLITLFAHQATIPFSFIWRLLGMGCLFGLVFGVIYPYLWNYSTFKAQVNIALSTVANTLGGFGILYLFSWEMFVRIQPFFWLILLVTLLGHIAGFYFYSNYENKKLAAALNRGRK